MPGLAGHILYIDRYIDPNRNKLLSFPMSTSKNSMIEPLIEHVPEGPSNRSFGYTVGGIIFCLMLAKWLISGNMTPITIGLAAIGVVLVVLALVAPATLTVPNLLWGKLGLLLFRIVNPVVMFLIYATTFVPIGLFMRWRGYDPLAASFDPAASTYWISRTSGEPVSSTMRNQF